MKMSGAEKAREVTRLVAEIRGGGGLDAIHRLIDVVKDLVPPGIEWGFEIARMPGISYIVEGGRIVALNLSKGEFGPFMETRIREISTRDLPAQSLARILEDPEGFVADLARHLREWRSRAHHTHPMRPLVDEFIGSLPST